MFPGGLTYSSHPVACAAALATIAVYEEDGLIARAQQTGKLLETLHADLAARQAGLKPRLYDQKRLHALPQRQPPQLLEMLGPRHQREEVVSGQLAGLAGEVGAAVGQQDFSLAHAARIEEQLAWEGIAGG